MTDYLLDEGVQVNLQADSLLGTAIQDIPKMAAFFQFREDGIEETFNFTFEGQPGVFDSIGDGGSYSAYLFDSDGNIAGTKDALKKHSILPLPESLAFSTQLVMVEAIQRICSTQMVTLRALRTQVSY